MRNLSLIFLIILVTSLVACHEDAYETGDTGLSYLSAEMVNMKVKGKEVVSITTDNQKALTFKKGMNVAESMARPDTIYRLMLYYSSVEGSPINIYDYYIVPQLNPMPLSETSTKDTDPLKLVSVCKSSDERFIDLSLGLLGSKTDERKHLICVTEDSVLTEKNGGKHHYFTLRHKQNDIPQYITTDMFASIPIAQYPSGTKFTITITTFGGIEKKEFSKR